MKIKNIYNEKLDVTISGDPTNNRAIIYSYGFGGRRGGGYSLSQNIESTFIKTHQFIRFDFSGYDQSEGLAQDGCLSKHAQDLNTVIKYVHKNLTLNISIIGHSLGSFILSKANLSNVTQAILLSPPSSGPDAAKTLKQKLVKRGVKFNPQGITYYQLSSGGTQELGKQFWQDLNNLDIDQELIKQLTATKITIIKPLQDEVAGNKNFTHYQQIKGLSYISLNGSHDFKDYQHRETLINQLSKLL
ncbi:MAG: hypothetical protein ABIJ43_05060 [Candidatus Beckwithbacteria bacterium]|nr:alpha/beta hydrolase [Patescibacteria group bacterium]